MSRTRKQYGRFSPRTGTVRRGNRQRSREDLGSQIEHEYGWDPRSARPERLWLQAPAPAAAAPSEDGEVTRAVRSFSLVHEDES